MNTQTIRSPGSLQDALYALALAKPVPDAAVLDDLVRRYPQYAEQLTDMAVALALEVLADRDEEPIPEDARGTSAAVGRAMSRFQNRLYAVTKSRQPANTNTTPGTANPFSSLDRAELRGLGNRLWRQHGVRDETAGPRHRPRHDDGGVSKTRRRKDARAA